MPTPKSSDLKAYNYLQTILIANENIEAWAIQIRLFALKHRRKLLAATTGRLIEIKPGLFGGFDVVDIRWQDLIDIQIKVGIFGSDFYIKKHRNSDLAIGLGIDVLFFEGFNKEQAQKIYQIAQAQEQAWREKRRIRELEEIRAKSGGITMGSNLNPTVNASSEDSLTRLQKAKQMLDSNLISDSEFESIKARIISSL